MNIPADWYDDPMDRSMYRYWDGTAWTDHRSPKAASALPPPVVMPVLPLTAGKAAPLQRRLLRVPVWGWMAGVLIVAVGAATGTTQNAPVTKTTRPEPSVLAEREVAPAAVRATAPTVAPTTTATTATTATVTTPTATTNAPRVATTTPAPIPVTTVPTAQQEAPESPTTAVDSTKPTTPRPIAAPASIERPPASVYYANCAAVRAAGKAPLRREDPGYRSGLDRDNDGIACE
jgi:hypothetical protein